MTSTVCRKARRLAADAIHPIRVLPVRAPRSEGRLLLDAMLREVDFLGQHYLPVIRVMFIGGRHTLDRLGTRRLS